MRLGYCYLILNEWLVKNDTMFHSLAHWALYAAEVLFFTGLAGCVLVVLISWISIFKTGFSKSDKNE